MNQKTALITGILGQDGPYLAKLLLDKGYKVYGMIRRYTNPNYSNLDYLGITNKINFVSGDMTDEASLTHIIKNTRPDEVYNLAAQSFVGLSWHLTKYTTEVNSMGVLHLLNAIKQHSPQTKFYQAGTSEMVGGAFDGNPITIKSKFMPQNPYGIAKLYSYWLTDNYRKSYSMFCVTGILFNHESPIRGMDFVTRKITDGVVRIKLGLTKEIRLGNLHAKRDWGFAGDFVEAMWLMLQQQTPEDFIISTGVPHSIRDFLDVSFKYVGIRDWEKYVTIDPQFYRPTETHVLHGDSTPAREKLGWKQKVSFDELVKMMIDADFKRLR